MTPANKENDKKHLEEFHITELPKYLLAYLADVLDLKKGVDPAATSEEIINNSSLAGANSWMLMCSIVIASIGLSQDSPAVIIGAMLISPLMSPILGIGHAIGINDMDSLWNSLTQFIIAISIAILTSYVYFELTPIKDFTPEMEARTMPTFLDIFVGVFGGLAGIISIARKDISTTLPGVAIATALMPPLCVTGYGLAVGDVRIASYSFYLFFLNTFFVALSTYVIVRYLQFPYKKFINEKSRRKNIFFIVAFSLALVIPSFLIFNKVLQNRNLDKKLEEFMMVCLERENRHLDGHYLDNDTLTILVYGNPIATPQKAIYEECLYDLGLDNYALNIISTSEVGLNDVRLLSEKVDIIASKMEGIETSSKSQEQLISYYQSVHTDSSEFKAIKTELRALYPEIVKLGIAHSHVTDFEEDTYSLPTVLIHWNKISATRQQEQNEKIGDFLKARLELDTIQILSLNTF